MKEKELRRSLSVLPIGTVMKLTDLSARQIRYYEQQGLVIPERNEGNRRMYSLNNVDQLLEIKDYLSEGINMAGIRHIYEQQKEREHAKQEQMQKSLTDTDVRRILREEIKAVGGLADRADKLSVHKKKL
ncbi:glutamine synthetase repressor [Ligilactobacillus acidipiscis DSM 15836]|jgi:DNA-binding transcriptional MerR regulator|uniref:MerR family transcriptional regulator n=2 Tax=Ligilactobacillus acidipiscis TaxID=89059 RepID=A0A921FB21_9LACO|nr:MerR family transcriptional regulator [Ligilactobacillus acidipiscis]KRM32220.1 glutamine synthetase repressor [Ligilactobacillus acidipiscis DSM 15836]MCI1925347.1 MerR family transcriptional regulator [Ligilactobacillus acidipiscis]MCI1954217.1 MerR family transcriptional regulator [Ligilactobacillus acidipiscis]WEV57972.1 MerR family transcriptional regulator [Ligilactobacillus acidipiscis]GAW64614.1 glutamine synthetase repressor [Ligilactobacillus acidipiscis]